jgi:hypothetical protein
MPLWLHDELLSVGRETRNRMNMTDEDETVLIEKATPRPVP